jgi:hypothetical protein
MAISTSNSYTAKIWPESIFLKIILLNLLIYYLFNYHTAIYLHQIFTLLLTFKALNETFISNLLIQLYSLNKLNSLYLAR